jgi:hypothetical protein
MSITMCNSTHIKSNVDIDRVKMTIFPYSKLIYLHIDFVESQQTIFYALHL